MSYSNRFTQSVHVQKPTGNDGYGKNSYSPAVERRVNVQLVDELVTDEHGEEVRSDSIIFFYDPTWIEYNDKVTLPDGKERIVAKIRKSPSLAGRETLYKAWMK